MLRTLSKQAVGQNMLRPTMDAVKLEMRKIRQWFQREPVVTALLGAIFGVDIYVKRSPM